MDIKGKFCCRTKRGTRSVNDLKLCLVCKKRKYVRQTRHQNGGNLTELSIKGAKRFIVLVPVVVVMA